MAGRDFDHFAREMGAAVDRRGALRVVTGVLIAVAATWRTRQGGLAQAPMHVVCGSDGDCPSDGGDPCLGAYCLDGVCQTFVVDCMPGDVCCGNGSCCPGVELIECFSDADCAFDSDDPCQAAQCESGLCAVLIVDCAPGFTCCGNLECCPADGDGCVTDADCGFGLPGGCGRWRCLNGVCLPGPVWCPDIPTADSLPSEP